MTREEAKELFSKCKSDFIIDKIYDSFENRCCKKCKYASIDTLGLIYCASPKSPLSSCLFAIHPNFSCNKWEPK